MAFSYEYAYCAILIFCTCAASQRNLEADLDTLKLAFDHMKISHQNEISALKEIIHNQGQEIDKMKKDHEHDIRTIRMDVDRCLSSHQDREEAVPDHDPGMGMDQDQQSKTPDVNDFQNQTVNTRSYNNFNT